MVKKRGKGKISKFSIQFLPYSRIKNLNSNERIKKLLNIASKNNIIVLQGRLEPEEEAELIKQTMIEIGKKKEFKGIELAVLPEKQEANLFEKLRRNFAKVLSGTDLNTFTVIGPAAIVKEINKNPEKIELFLNNRR